MRLFIMVIIILTKLKNKQKQVLHPNSSFIQAALTFDQKDIFQFCFDILKDKRIYFKFRFLHRYKIFNLE